MVCTGDGAGGKEELKMKREGMGWDADDRDGSSGQLSVDDAARGHHHRQTKWSQLMATER